MMKTIIKIAGLLCILLAFPISGSAQWRFGMEGGPGFSPAYEYDSEGYFLDKDKSGRLFGQANIMADYLLPRKWTPNYLALSLRAGLGFMWVEDCSSFDVGETYTQSMGVGIPLEVEVKYLLTNRTRVYLNGGVTPYINVSSSDSWYFSPVDEQEMIDEYGPRSFILGYQFGLGIEYGNFRIGYKHFCLSKTIDKAGYGNKMKPAHALSFGFWFGGSRLLKKHSALKAY